MCVIYNVHCTRSVVHVHVCVHIVSEALFFFLSFVPPVQTHEHFHEKCESVWQCLVFLFLLLYALFTHSMYT